MHRRTLKAGMVAVALVVVIAGLTTWAIFSTQRPPVFYKLALQTPSEQSELAGDQFEETIIQLSNDMRRDGSWQATLTQEQINGWIASDLPVKFPKLLSPSIAEPRLSIEDATLNVAFRFNSRSWSGIIHIQGEVFCTQNNNQIAIRIHELRSGLVSIPLETWSHRVQESLAKSDIGMTWTDIDGDAVALIDLPQQVTDRSDQRVSIESITLLDGSIHLSGTTVARPNAKRP